MTITLSPYAQTMGMTLAVDDAGHAVVAMDFSSAHEGRVGFLHGGAIAGLLETAAFAAVAQALTDKIQPRLKPINCTVTYMRGGQPRPSYANAKIVRLGKRVANVEAIAWQDDRAKPIAMAQMNVLIDRS